MVKSVGYIILYHSWEGGGGGSCDRLVGASSATGLPMDAPIYASDRKYVRRFAVNHCITHCKRCLTT